MRIFAALIGLIVSVSVTQAFAGKQKGFLVKTGFEYKGKNTTSKSESTFILDAKNKTWTALSEPKDGIALLGRVTASDAKSLQMEYIVVDTNQKSAVISTSAIRAVWGEVAKIEVGQLEGEKILVSLLATPTEYTGKK